MSASRSTLIACLIATALALLFIPVGESAVTPNDFAFYWTAARLVLHGKNPYSPSETVDLQNRLGFRRKRSLGDAEVPVRNVPAIKWPVAPDGATEVASD